MQVAPALDDSKTGGLEKFLPTHQRPKLLAHARLVCPAVESQPRGRKIAFGTSRRNSASGLATRTISRSALVGSRKCSSAQTGNKIELSVGKRQFFRRPAMKLRMGQRIPANIQGHPREIDSRRDSAKRRGRAQPEAGAARNVQNSFPVPRLEAVANRRRCPGTSPGAEGHRNKRDRRSPESHRGRGNPFAHSLFVQIVTAMSNFHVPGVKPNRTRAFNLPFSQPKTVAWRAAVPFSRPRSVRKPDRA